jgi:glycosidase
MTTPAGDDHDHDHDHQQGQWLNDAVFYEIYPQSFADSNGDGIGDLPGVIEHLDHLAWLGVNTIWFNPCFASPFRDAGYDVSDYEQIAPRYGTNDDMSALVQAAQQRGIRVVLDLVAGHTSVAHAWFRASANDPTDDRYIWSDQPGDGFVPSTGTRPGYYLKNFFDEQPALNFGYASLDPSEPWREGVDAPGPQANRAALREIIAFWLDRGIAGFRVDMAYSLVKDDPDRDETTALWHDLHAWMVGAYPDAILLPESDYPAAADLGVRGGFDADFFLVIHPAHSSLFNNGGAGWLPWLRDQKHCFFEADGADGPAMLGRFLQIWDDHRAATDPHRRIVLTSADHDYSRLASGTRTAEQLGAAFTFLLTWGSIPSIYYGDEIGMRNLSGLPDHEGSICNPGYNRAGCRTPMQWDEARPNAGFSNAPKDQLYLPQDPDPHRPTVAAQVDDPGSTLNIVRRLIALRRSTPALGTSAPTTVLTRDYPFAYLRGDSHLVVVNPRREAATADVAALAGRSARPLEVSGVQVIADQQDAGRIEADGFGYAVFELE